MDEMLTKFRNLETEKQGRILNAAIKEFAYKGYDLASTNEIVKEAGISKGLLFHYFKNKQQLYLFVFDYCAEKSVRELYDHVDFEQTDIFARVRDIMKFKLVLLSKYPDMMEFLKTARVDSSAMNKEYVADRIKEMSEAGYAKLFDGIDISRFKVGVDLEKAMNIIMWTFDGLSVAELAKIKEAPSKMIDYDRIFAEADVYTTMLQKVIYKE